MRHSAKLDKIASALHVVQSRVQPVKRDALNHDTDSRYSTIVAVREALAQPMIDVGLSYSQEATVLQVGPLYFVNVTTILMHESQQWIEGAMQLPLSVMTTQQGAAAVTFAKRYGLCALMGVVSETEDRDSEGQEPEPVIEKRFTRILKAERAKGIGEYFKQVFIADEQRFVCRDPKVAGEVAAGVGADLMLTLKGYADGEVEIIGVDEGVLGELHTMELPSGSAHS